MNFSRVKLRAESDLRPSLDNVVFAVSGECTFNILWLSLVDSLDHLANLANLLHELAAELTISCEAIRAVVDTLFFLVLNRIAVKKAGSSKTRQVLTVRVATEDETTVSHQLDRLVCIGIYTTFFEAMG